MAGVLPPGGLHPGGSASGGMLSPEGGLHPRGGGLPPWGVGQTRPSSETEKRAVRILLECFLVFKDFVFTTFVSAAVSYKSLPKLCRLFKDSIAYHLLQRVREGKSLTLFSN